MYIVRQIPENTDRVVSGLILTKVLLRNLEFEIELYLVRQIPENTEVGHLLHIHCVLRLSVFYYVC